jgi:hypothetical protein
MTWLHFVGLCFFAHFIIVLLASSGHFMRGFSHHQIQTTLW